MNKRSGFTIVELLVVIVVIGVLASISLVSYNSISNKAIEASLQSDLINVSKQFKVFHVLNNNYPSTFSTDCASSPDTATNICLKPSSGNTYYAYCKSTPESFSIRAKNGSNVWVITDNTVPVVYTPDPSWVDGRAGTSMECKYVYHTNVYSYPWKTTNTACISPQCSNGSLVSDNNVDFSLYPARNQCKSLGGYIPNDNQLLEIYAGRATYGNNLVNPVGAVLWSSREYSTSRAIVMIPTNGSFGAGEGIEKISNTAVRCIKD